MWGCNRALRGWGSASRPPCMRVGRRVLLVPCAQHVAWQPRSGQPRSPPPPQSKDAHTRAHLHTRMHERTNAPTVDTCLHRRTARPSPPPCATSLLHVTSLMHPHARTYAPAGKPQQRGDCAGVVAGLRQRHQLLDQVAVVAVVQAGHTCTSQTGGGRGVVDGQHRGTACNTYNACRTCASTSVRRDSIAARTGMVAAHAPPTPQPPCRTWLMSRVATGPPSPPSSRRASSSAICGSRRSLAITLTCSAARQQHGSTAAWHGAQQSKGKERHRPQDVACLAYREGGGGLERWEGGGGAHKRRWGRGAAAPLGVYACLCRERQQQHPLGPCLTAGPSAAAGPAPNPSGLPPHTPDPAVHPPAHPGPPLTAS